MADPRKDDRRGETGPLGDGGRDGANQTGQGTGKPGGGNRGGSRGGDGRDDGEGRNPGVGHDEDRGARRNRPRSL